MSSRIDRRRLAAELERAAGDALAAERRDAPAGRGRAGERDLVDARVAHEQLGHLAVGGDDVEHARRQADRLGDLGDHVGLARAPPATTLSTTVQPASSAGAILLAMSGIGAFHGMIAPTTPTGSRTSRPNPPPRASGWPLLEREVSARPA